jgi:peptidylprolyl isomerase
MRGQSHTLRVFRGIGCVAVVFLVALLAAGCGGKSKSSSVTSSTTSAPASTSSSTSASKPGKVPKAPGEDKLGSKPKIGKPTGDPPSTLQKRDIVKGNGDEAKPGAKVTVQYVGIAWSTGKQFDASWDRGQPFKFQLGAGMVIPGWDEGVAGMKVGGRRQLIIPPDMAYGPQGQPPDIGPNETLVFDIDLLKVKK